MVLVGSSPFSAMYLSMFVDWSFERGAFLCWPQSRDSYVFKKTGTYPDLLRIYISLDNFTYSYVQITTFPPMAKLLHSLY